MSVGPWTFSRALNFPLLTLTSVRAVASDDAGERPSIHSIRWIVESSLLLQRGFRRMLYCVSITALTVAAGGNVCFCFKSIGTNLN